MAAEQLQLMACPKFERARMVLGFSGWMDGGEVSTGTVEYLAEYLGYKQLGSINPDEFYIYNMPGNMEVSSIFRPHVVIKEGLVTRYDDSENAFYYDERDELILFLGREPNLRWGKFAECLLAVAEEFNVCEIYFIGSVAGMVPHTRDPRFSCAVSHESLKKQLEQYNIRFSNYDGPASFTAFLTKAAAEKGVLMTSLVAEIPAYIQGRNPRCVEAMVRRLGTLLDLEVNVDALRLVGDEVEIRLDKIVQQQPELVEHIKTLEENYDTDVFDTQMGDLQEWLKGRGIRLD